MAEIGLFFLVLIWTTKEQLSQGKLGGRRGSSACTIISIFLAELASKSCKLLLPHHGRLCNKWHSAVAEAISEGNSIYDRYGLINRAYFLMFMMWGKYMKQA